MIATSGTKRVIITNVLPSVDNGAFPAKAIVNKQLEISADIFADGHDHIAAAIQIKHTSEKQWNELPLKFCENDRWLATYVPSILGTYQFRILAWIDHFSTWQADIHKKYLAGQDISVDLKAGVKIVQEAIGRSTGKNKEALILWADDLDNASNIEDSYALSQSYIISPILNKCRDKSKVTTHPQTFEITIDPPKAGFSAWYELFPRSASAEPGKHGTFNDVINLLPRISKMGFDVLYLPPIHPIGFKHRKGRNNSLTATENDPGSPWAIGNKTGGHKAINAELGTLKDFKKLVSEARKLDIDIAMDIAFQCSPDHPYVKQHPEWFKWRADGTVQFAENPPKKYEDILPFNFESEDWQGLWEELKSVFEYWVDKGVTIFRVDNPHTKAIPFWEWAIKELKAEHPELIFLAEAFTRPRIMEQLAKAGFSQSYTYFTWRNAKWELQEYVNELTKTNLRYYFRPNFWPNTPDILTQELVTGGENMHIIKLILAATLSSNYGLYGPVYDFAINEPMPGKEEYNDNEKYEIKYWDWNCYTKIREVMTRINRIRKENPALQETFNIEFAETDNDNIICFMKSDASRENIMIIAINLDPHNTQSANIKLPLHKFGLKYDEHYTVHDLLSGDKFQWYSDRNWVSLNPYDLPAHILRMAK
jgi:starch synthase (maltosyl-transferring)